MYAKQFPLLRADSFCAGQGNKESGTAIVESRTLVGFFKDGVEPTRFMENASLVTRQSQGRG
jgi:hypothetical protein